MSTDYAATDSKNSLQGRRDVRVFLCYRRNDGAWHAEWLNHELDKLEYDDKDGTTCDLHIYYDKTAPGVANWKELHFPSLQSSHALILICTPGIATDLSRHGEPDWVYKELSWWTKHRNIAPIVIDATGEGDRWLPEFIRRRWPDLNRLDLRREDVEAAARKGDRGFADRIRRRVVSSIQESERATVFEDLERFRRLTARLKVALVGMGVLLVTAVAAGLIAWGFSRVADHRAEETRHRLYFTQLVVAESNYYDNNLRRTRELLESSPDDLRHWEWKYLWRRLHQSRTSIPIHRSHADSVDFSRDGQFIASGGESIRVWVAKSAEEIVRIPSEASSVAFSPVLDQIASASDSAITLWDMSGEMVYAINQGASMVKFSPEGRRIVSASWDSIDVWEAHSGKLLMSLGGVGDGIKSVAIAQGGMKVAAAVLVGNGGQIKIWNTTEPGSPSVLGTAEEESALHLAFSPDGRQLASGGRSVIKLWDVETRQEVLKIHEAGEFVRAVAFSPSGDLLASGSSDNTIQVWDVHTGANRKTLRGHESEVLDLVFAPSGTELASSSWDETIKIWDVVADVEARTLDGHRSVVNSVTVSADNSYIASASWDGTVRLWNLESGEQIRVLFDGSSGPDGTIRGVAFSPAPNSKILAAVIEDQLRAWDVETGLDVISPLKLEGDITAMALSPDGEYAAFGTLEGAIALWDLRARRTLLNRQWEDEGIVGVQSVAFSPDGSRLVASGNGPLVRVWDLTTGEVELTLSGHDTSLSSATATGVNTVSYSPDGKLIVSGGDDGLVKLWDAEDGTELRALRGHQERVKSVAFSPDGKRIVSGSQDTAIKIWDTKSGLEVITLNGHTLQVLSVTFSPDGEYIVSGSTDKTIKVW